MRSELKDIVKRSPAVFIIAAVMLSVGGDLYAQSVLELGEGDPVSIGTIRKLHSDAIGEERTMLVWLPRDYEGTAFRFPVLYLLYGDQVEGYFAETVHHVSRLGTNGAIPQLIVVGIANVERYRDLRPDEQRGNPSGIEPFTRFLGEELIPFIDEEYRTKDFRILVGPQAGGVFGLHELTGGTNLFNAYILENPLYSESCSDILMERSERFFADGPDRYSFLQITCASRTVHQDRSESFDMAKRFEELVSGLHPERLDLHMIYIDDNEDFIPSPQQKRGLKTLFADYAFPEGRKVERLADFTSHYDDLSRKFGFDIGFPEIPLVMKAVGLDREGKTAEAVEIFEFILDKNPMSLNGYWQLANIRRVKGDREGAMEYYKKCLELMPNMAPAREWLERLENQ